MADTTRLQLQDVSAGATHVAPQSFQVSTGGTSQAVSVSTTSAQSTAINSPTAMLYSTVDVFLRQGSNPTAVADGTDQILPAFTLVRAYKITVGNKLAFKTASGTGTVYITPDV